MSRRKPSVVEQRLEGFDWSKHTEVFYFKSERPWRLFHVPAHNGPEGWVTLFNGHRKRLGVTAFYTKAEAVAEQMHRCAVLATSLQRFQNGQPWDPRHMAYMGALNFLTAPEKP